MAKVTLQNSKISDTYKVGIKMYLLLRTIGFMLPIFSVRLANYLSIYYYIAIVLFWQMNYKRIYFYKILLCMLLVFSFYRTYIKDVSHWVGNTSQKYYFYDIYLPYYSVFEDVPYNVETHRRLIYYQENLKD